MAIPGLDLLGGGGDTQAAAGKAGEIQSQALQVGVGLTQAAAERARGRVQPFITQGQESIAGLRAGLTTDTLLPSSQFALEEGSRALNRQQAATGKLRSGEGQIAFSDFIADIFNRDRDEKVRRAEGIRGVGIGQLGALNVLDIANARSGAVLTQQAAGINASLLQQQAAAQQARGSALGQIAGAGIGFAVGGPAGAAIGGTAGGAIGGGVI